MRSMVLTTVERPKAPTSPVSPARSVARCSAGAACAGVTSPIVTASELATAIGTVPSTPRILPVSA
ncbi:hypothetical protein [Leifsonia xyli]|uniref:hypothetical protein n=1 Tax=Leifsonia xyli TaxID=1575 RepID=UPI003D676DEA